MHVGFLGEERRTGRVTGRNSVLNYVYIYIRVVGCGVGGVGGVSRVSRVRSRTVQYSNLDDDDEKLESVRRAWPNGRRAAVAAWCS